MSERPHRSELFHSKLGRSVEYLKGELLVIAQELGERFEIEEDVVISHLLTELGDSFRRNPVYRYLGTSKRGILRTRMAGRDRAAAQIYGEESFRKRFGREAERSRIEEEED